MEMPPRIIESKWEQTPEGGTELNYYNGDLCSYYLFRENDRSYNLNPGKNTVFRIEKGSNASNSFKTSSRYMFFRGQFPKDFQISTPYALPVKTGEETQWQIAPQESAKTMIFQIQEESPVRQCCHSNCWYTTPTIPLPLTLWCVKTSSRRVKKSWPGNPLG